MFIDMISMRMNGIGFEFNKIIFSEILYTHLTNWFYQIKEIQSFELRNYILPLHDSPASSRQIDWNLIEKLLNIIIVKRRHRMI